MLGKLQPLNSKLSDNAILESKLINRSFWLRKQNRKFWIICILFSISVVFWVLFRQCLSPRYQLISMVLLIVEYGCYLYIYLRVSRFRNGLDYLILKALFPEYVPASLSRKTIKSKQIKPILNSIRGDLLFKYMNDEELSTDFNTICNYATQIDRLSSRIQSFATKYPYFCLVGIPAIFGGISIIISKVILFTEVWCVVIWCTYVLGGILLSCQIGDNIWKVKVDKTASQYTNVLKALQAIIEK